MTLYGGTWAQGPRPPWDPYDQAVFSSTPWQMTHCGLALLPDGSVLVGTFRNAYRLFPDRQGNYLNGRWERARPRLTQSRAVQCMRLVDGRVLYWYGEFRLTGSPNLIESYDPIFNSWETQIIPWTAAFRKVDEPGSILPDGRILICTGGTDTLLAGGNTGRGMVFDPASNTWTPTGMFPLTDSGSRVWQGEAQISLRQNGTVVMVPLATEAGTFEPGQYFHYPALLDPVTLTWSTTARFPFINVSPTHTPGYEVADFGPLIQLTSGKLVSLGSYQGKTQTLDPSQGAGGSWAAGPVMPVLPGQTSNAAQMDNAAAILPNGNWLVVGGDFLTTEFWNMPTQVMEFDGTTFGALATQPTTANESFEDRMLPLPNGQVLYLKDEHLWFFTPANTTPPAGSAPLISDIRLTGAPTTTLSPGNAYTVRGNRLSGVTLGVGMEDEGPANANLPIVKLSYADGTVIYCHTINTRRQSDNAPYAGIDPASATQCDFFFPNTVPNGAATLYVVSANMRSAGVAVTISGAGQPWSPPLTLSGGFGAAYSDGAGGYRYDGTLTRAHPMPSSPPNTSQIANGSVGYRTLSVTASGGTAPYTYVLDPTEPLPAGVTFFSNSSGCGLAGAPTTAGDYPDQSSTGDGATEQWVTLTVIATDANGTTGQGHFLIRCLDQGPFGYVQDSVGLSDSVSVIFDSPNREAGVSDPANATDSAARTATMNRTVGDSSSNLVG